VKRRQVNYDGELGREGRKRERDIADWGERERTEMRRENSLGGKKGQHWLILTDGLNHTMGIFGYGKQSNEHTDIFVHGK
jgi:hypothetical protein